MMKRLLALLFALTLLCSCAHAQQENAAIATYVLPEGAQVFYLPYGEAPQPAEGLEDMYALMQADAFTGDLYVIQMANGRALASVSCMPARRAMSAEQLRDLWPQTVKNILETAVFVNEDDGCAVVEECFGLEMLHIRTQIGVGDAEDQLMLRAEGFAFSESGSMTEIWTIHPQEDLYESDVQGARALSEDKLDLQEFVESITFMGGDTTILTGMPYQDYKGRFQMMIPAESAVLTPESAQEQVQQVRKQYIDSNPEGADRVFDRFMQQMEDVGSTFIFTPDMQGVIEIYAGKEDRLAGMLPEDLIKRSGSIQEMMAQHYDVAVCMEPDERTIISGVEHALMGYWLRMGAFDLQLDLMVCVQEDNWMYEVDIYAAEGSQDVRMALHAFVSQSLMYTPPVNGLE